MIEGKPWFVANDICDVLEIGNSRQALTGLDDDEKCCVIINDAIGRPRNTSIINEPGFYSLVGKSRKPQAKVFKRWVNHKANNN